MIKTLFAPGNDSILTSFSLLVLRVWMGLAIFFIHGLEKLGHFNDVADHFPNPVTVDVNISLALVTLAETAGALLLVLGLLTRVGAVMLVIVLSIAYLTLHKEPALIYLAGCVALLLAGPGGFSADRALFGRGK